MTFDRILEILAVVVPVIIAIFGFASGLAAKYIAAQVSREMRPIVNDLNRAKEDIAYLRGVVDANASNVGRDYGKQGPE